MLKIENYIDIKWTIEEYYYRCPIKSFTRYDYVDRDIINAIKKSDKKNVEMKLKIIENVIDENVKYVKIKNKIDNEHITQFYYKNKDDQTYLFLISLTSDMDNDFGFMMGYINNVSGDYLILGNVGCHPFFSTEKFSYGNSDGSGPSLSNFIKCDNKKKTIDHKKIAEGIIIMMEGLMDNDWH